jgi:hypothetical protein
MAWKQASKKEGQAEAIASGKARAKLAAEDLSPYAVVCLVNVTDPQAAGWKKLEDFATRGGGVAIFLGDRVSAAPYQSPAATNVLPGKPVASFTFNPPEFLDLQNLTHPILRKFVDWDASVLTSVEINAYWSVDASEGAGIIARGDPRDPLPRLRVRRVVVVGAEEGVDELCRRLSYADVRSERARDPAETLGIRRKKEKRVGCVDQ